MTLSGFSDRAVRLYGWILDQVELDDRPMLARPWPAPEVHWDSLWTDDPEPRYLGPPLGEASVVRLYLRRTIAAVGTGVIVSLWYEDVERVRPRVSLPVWDNEVKLFEFSRSTKVRWISLDAVGIRSETRA